MPLNVSEFRSNMAYDGARPNRYEVLLNIPSSIAGLAPDFNRKIAFMARATNTPDLNLGVTPVPYQGRLINLAGNRTFGEWTITIYNDEDFAIRRALEAWNNAINTLEGNVRRFGIGGGGGLSYDYVTDGKVNQLSKFEDERIIRSYTMISCWPSVVAGMPLGWDQNDTVQEFDVTLTFDFWKPDDFAV